MDFVRYDTRPKPKPWRGQLFKTARCEIKLDGHRLTIFKDRGPIMAVSRKTTAANMWPDVSQCLDSDTLDKIERMPDGTALDGELWFPNLQASSVVTRLNDGDPLRFSPFAVPFHKHADLRYARFAVCDRALDELGFAPAGQVLDWRERDLKDYARYLGVEGFVIKEMPYAKWWKVKPLETIDAFVTAVEPGQGKHRGRNGAMHLAVYAAHSIQDEHYIHSVGKVGIGEDDMWRDMLPQNMLGRVCEVAFEGRAANGALKFPRFIRWREDKEPKDCGADQC